ncbi:excalibur calcium-binding domain-containing protein [Psychrobacter aquaticus]|uniref:excalibur calcium-binding domain-containing protein n=1 Tax=Psychrobacter aquaticus TaxID=248452 RepID=UPI0005901DF7
MKNTLIIIMLLVLAFAVYKVLQPDSSTSNTTIDVATDTSTTPVSISTSTDFDDIPPTYVDSGLETLSAPVVKPALSTPPATPSFACDGRQHCSQMTSCAEATYFSNNCPNTKMDGNNDGVPCEEQWCN